MSATAEGAVHQITVVISLCPLVQEVEPTYNREKYCAANNMVLLACVSLVLVAQSTARIR